MVVVQQVDGLVAASLGSHVLKIAIATALGMFLGLEREWSQKSAGIRTFALISLLGAMFAILSTSTGIGIALLVVGGGLVIVMGVLLAVQGLLAEEGLALTTTVSMLVTYGVGVLVATDFIIEGVTVAVVSSLLLVLKRELHTLAWGLSREEIQSATEFAILAFVVFPLLPVKPVAVDGAAVTVVPSNQCRDLICVEPRVVWLMVVFVAGIGIVNYAIVQKYGGRGIAVSGFFGGLASSTAVVGTMLDHVRQDPDAASYALAAILLADAAMALRNLTIAVAFTIESPSGVLTGVVWPLLAVTVGGVAVAAVTADWSVPVSFDLESPFSLRNALAFGGVFLIVVVAGAVAKAQFGGVGFVVTAAVTSLVSSAGATTSAVALARTGTISDGTAVIAILTATATSIGVKAGLTMVGSNWTFARRVTAWSGGLVAVGGVITVATLALGGA